MGVGRWEMATQSKKCGMKNEMKPTSNRNHCSTRHSLAKSKQRKQRDTLTMVATL